METIKTMCFAGLDFFLHHFTTNKMMYGVRKKRKLIKNELTPPPRPFPRPLLDSPLISCPSAP